MFEHLADIIGKRAASQYKYALLPTGTRVIEEYTLDDGIIRYELVDAGRGWWAVKSRNTPRLIYVSR